MLSLTSKEMCFPFVLLSCIIKHADLNKTNTVHVASSGSRLNNGLLANSHTLEAKMVLAKWQLSCRL
jgi:hypothetical protein